MFVLPALFCSLKATTQAQDAKPAKEPGINIPDLTNQ
jgi:hypothetical protein